MKTYVDRPDETTDEPAWKPAERRLAVNVALACRLLSEAGHDDFNQGQVSARLPGSERFVIKSATCGFDEATPSDVILAEVAFQEAVHPLAPPELPLHQAIYQARPDVNAVVHSHAPYTLAFGAVDMEIAPVSHDGSLFFGRVPRFTLTSNTVLDSDTAASVAAVLGEHPAAFLRNHGGVVVGKTLRIAAIGAQVLERACMLQLLAASAGRPYSVSSEQDVAVKRDYIYSDTAVKSYWDYCVRRIHRMHPETTTWS